MSAKIRNGGNMQNDFGKSCEVSVIQKKTRLRPLIFYHFFT